MKAKAVVEVVVVFSLTLFLVALAGLSPVGEWVRQATNRAFSEYVVMIAVPLLILVVTRRDLTSYGVSLRNFRYHLDIALTAFVPVAFASVPFMFVDETRWDGALIMIGVEIAVLFALSWLLRRKPTRNESGMLVGALLLVNYSSLAGKATVGNGISALLFYIFFLGLGEELLFRGYILSRLNEAFGKPYQFFGINLGWGIVITSILFGIMHFLNLGSLVMGNWQLTPWWGLWTFFGGLVNGLVREKTGSIVAPTILHGLPQGIAYAFLGL
jgi:membrane protease YdiL (CAAX protease family)